MSLLSRLAMIGVLIGGYKIYQDREDQKYWKQYEDSLFNSESEGQKVRNRLQGSDVYPEDDMLETPSIYRNWPMVQKGYQSLRMMNDNDNFNADEGDSCDFCGDLINVTSCITDLEDWNPKNCGKLVCDECQVQLLTPSEDGKSYWVTGFCPICAQEEVSSGEMFNADGYKKFGSEWHHFAPCETAGCDGDIEYRDVYYCSSCGQDDTEILIGDRCPECEEVATDTATYAIFYCSDCGEDFSDEYNAEVRTLSGKPLQLRKLTKDRDLKPEDAIERLEISAEGEYRKCTICEEPAHPLYRGKGSLEGARRICYSCNKQAMKDRPSFNNSMTFDADEFNAYVYRGKPMTELSYSGKAMATKKMIDAADLEATMLQLENAIRLGIISEDELMKELQNKLARSDCMKYYIVSTDDEDADADDIITISNPKLNMIGEARIVDQGKITSDNPSDTYEFRIVENYNGKVVNIKDITTSKDPYDQTLKSMLTKAYANKKMSINCDYSWAMTKVFENDLIMPRDYPYYLITDGGNVTMQSYNYFWDDDPKFQKTFRDNMGGNHQWELHWCNMGGRSGVADIMAVSTNAATTPILSYLWKAGGSSGDTYQGLYNFIKSNCRTNSPPEFSKRNDYIKERMIHHMSNDLESKEAFEYAVQDVRSLTQRKDPSIWYQEYENMGFNHPRPDYLDPKWKL